MGICWKVSFGFWIPNMRVAFFPCVNFRKGRRPVLRTIHRIIIRDHAPRSINRTMPYRQAPCSLKHTYLLIKGGLDWFCDDNDLPRLFQRCLLQTLGCSAESEPIVLSLLSVCRCDQDNWQGGSWRSHATWQKVAESTRVPIDDVFLCVQLNRDEDLAWANLERTVYLAM